MNFLPAVATLACFFSLLRSQETSAISVLMQHNDLARTGANTNEQVLSPANVNSNTFGKKFNRPVDDQIYTQPLYVPGVNVPGKGIHNVIYVATVTNSVYAFDADDPLQTNALWRVNFNNPAANIIPVYHLDVGQACGVYNDFSGSIGIVGTPAIDPSTGTLYLVARTRENGTNFVQRLHALDLATGAEKPNSPVIIQGNYPGTGAGSVGGIITFDPKIQNQRSALTLVGNIVYIAWASHCDTGPYHGWIMGYDAQSLMQVSIYNTTPSGSEAGIWQSGQGPSVDPAGNLYVISGNGTFNATNGVSYGDSFIKLSSANGLAVTDWFTPFNQATLNGRDEDLGSAGALLIPGTRRLVGGGKQGVFYVLNMDNMGHFNPANDSQIVQSFQACGGHIHGSPVYWNSPVGQLVYIWSETDSLKAYLWNGTTFVTTPQSRGTVVLPTGMPGAMLSVSANGNSGGIVWAHHPIGNANQATRPGVLRAYDATDLGRELWNSQMNPARDDLGNFAKFTYPTVANGKVYLATFSNQLWVYGLNQSPQVNLSAPLPGSVFYAPTNLLLSATASESDGTIQRVEFFNGTNRLAQVTNAPFTFSWTNVSTGSYDVFARALDNFGSFSTSQVAHVTVAYHLSLKTAQVSLTNGVFHIPVSGLAGKSYVLQASTNLVNWSPLSTNAAVADDFEFVDAAAGNAPYRFYRVLGSP